MDVEHAVIISILMSHYRVEVALGKSALQLLESHTTSFQKLVDHKGPGCRTES